MENLDKIPMTKTVKKTANVVRHKDTIKEQEEIIKTLSILSVNMHRNISNIKITKNPCYENIIEQNKSLIIMYRQIIKMLAESIHI